MVIRMEQTSPPICLELHSVICLPTKLYPHASFSGSPPVPPPTLTLLSEWPGSANLPSLLIVCVPCENKDTYGLITQGQGNQGYLWGLTDMKASVSSVLSGCVASPLWACFLIYNM